ncbi:hypothetical protein [Actinokineospora sp. NBRC 105648]|uniref:hypothetical protein n=1 Tax=Actinokineospora sp. NBRC 105648 TaxID=3032206 RepID=UPI0024A42F6A|nr:hypothetical protein [Actinokineospora sp. NBRC 105648]GLZ38955.1 hypothetical protein Acsp05_25790 [Actinokineospora sp. NBRC 105648]
MRRRSPAGHTVRALVRSVAEETGHDAAFLVDDEVHAWPADAAVEPESGVVEEVPGGGVLVVAGAVDRAVLRRAAARIAVAVAGERLTAERDRLAERADGLTEDVRVARDRLSRVRELERRRLVGALTAFTTREFADLRELLEPLALDDFRVTLDEVIDRFRKVVRGVHPAMLPERGPAAALGELAADVARPFRFEGDLGRRVGWEVESGLYHAAAAVVAQLAESAAAQAVRVRLSRSDGALRVRFTDAGSGLTDVELRAALADDAERLAAFGGTLTTSVTAGVAEVRILLPERLDEPADGSEVDIPSTLLARVRALVAAGARGSGEWDAQAERLDRPPVVAVVGESGTAEVVVALTGVDLPGRGSATATWYEHAPVRDVPVGPAATEPDAVVRLPVPILRHLTLVDVPQCPDSTMIAPGGPLADVDVVLLLDSDNDFRRAARSAPRRVDVLTPDADVESQLRGRVVARADLYAARAVLAAVRTLPADSAVSRLRDQVLADAHELAELDVLGDLETGVLTLHANQDRAFRLLGARGRTAHERLALPASATSAEVVAAAVAAAADWRDRAASPATGSRERDACQVLVRTCEGLATTPQD